MIIGPRPDLQTRTEQRAEQCSLRRSVSIIDYIQYGEEGYELKVYLHGLLVLRLRRDRTMLGSLDKNTN